MSASTDLTQALIARLNERGNITCADISAVLDTIINQKLAEFVSDMERAHGLSLPEVESLTEMQTAMVREWKASVLDELTERVLTMKANAPTAPTVQ